ncbi:MAG: carboxypeptidase-like regulatory domain-containing protein [Bacteroidota bacterium]
MEPIYNDAQKNLYSGLNIVWNNYGANVTAFGNFKGKYDEQFGVDALAAIQVALNLPDHGTVLGDIDVLRVDMVNKSVFVINDYHRTERYIDDLFLDKDVREGEYKKAGHDFLDDSNKNGWASLVELGNKNFSYVTTNKIALEMSGMNMPATFPANVETHLNDFKDAYDTYEDARQTSEETTAKVKANNNIWISGRSMMNDAKEIFYNMPDKLKLFTWKTIMRLVNHKVAGLQGLIKEKGTNVPLPNVHITMQKKGEIAFTITTDENGKYAVKGIASGTYTYVVMLAGKKTITGQIKIKVGTVSRRNFEMES